MEDDVDAQLAEAQLRIEHLRAQIERDERHLQALEARAAQEVARATHVKVDLGRARHQLTERRETLLSINQMLDERSGLSKKQ